MKANLTKTLYPVGMVIVFLLLLFIIKEPLWLLLLVVLTNLILTFAVYFFIRKFSSGRIQLMGYLYLTGTFIKLIIVVAVLLPFLKTHMESKAQILLTLFLPYLLGQVFLTVNLIKWLKKKEF